MKKIRTIKARLLVSNKQLICVPTSAEYIMRKLHLPFTTSDKICSQEVHGCFQCNFSVQDYIGINKLRGDN
jgi:hypothetical protein